MGNSTLFDRRNYASPDNLNSIISQKYLTELVRYVETAKQILKLEIPMASALLCN